MRAKIDAIPAKPGSVAAARVADVAVFAGERYRLALGVKESQVQILSADTANDALISGNRGSRAFFVAVRIG